MRLSPDLTMSCKDATGRKELSLKNLQRKVELGSH